MEYLTISLSVLAVLVAIYYYYFRNLNLFKKHGIPHLPPVPLLGNIGPVVTMKTSLSDLIVELYNLNADAKYVGFYEFTSPIIFIRDLDLIKSISVKNCDSFMDHRSFLNKKSDPLLGGTLFFQNGEEWKHERSMVSPVFTSSKIKSMYKLMSDCAVRFADYLSKLPEGEREMEMKLLLYRYTNDVIASCAFGLEVDSIKDPRNELYVKGQKAVNFTGFVTFVKQMMYRHLPSLSNMLGVTFITKSVTRFFENLIRDTMKTRQKNGIYRQDMLQLLIDSKNRKGSGKSLSTPSITSHAFGFFFGGFDSVSTQSSFIFRQLAEHPDVQAKLQTEVDEALQKNNGELAYDVIMQMEYLDAVVNETMRLFSIIPFLDRVCTKPFELPPAVPGAKPFTVQPGMNVWFPVWAIHRDSKYYDNPKMFDPERFMNDRKKNINSDAFMPFGVGPRMCIGNRFALTEVKVLICHILSRCDIKLSPKSPAPLELNKGTLIMQPKNGFWMKIEPRKGIFNGNGMWINGICKVTN